MSVSHADEFRSLGHGLGKLWRRELLPRARKARDGRGRTVVLFACVLALDTANLSSLGAIAGQLKLSLHIDNTQLGVLAAAPPLLGAIFTLPMGVLADRVRRVELLSATIALWSGAMLVCGASGSFTMLLFARMFLGAVTAAAGPLLASLVGDLFRPEERGRVYGYIIAGELLGSLVGLLVAGNLAALSWRLALWFLAVPSLLLAVLVHRLVHEPQRGRATDERPDGNCAPRRDLLARLLRERDVRPRRGLVLDRDPRALSLWRAVRYVLRIRTNDLLIVSSALGYFFQAGVNTFGVVFLASQYRLVQSEATSLLALVALGALAGTLVGGRFADRLLARGRVSARMLVGGVSFVVSTVIFVPGLLGSSLALSIPLYFLAAAALAAPNGALDAARLDIVPARLRGRAEAVRTTLRTVAVAISPLVFGYVSDRLASGPRSYTKGIVYSVSASGLKYTFLLMLIPMMSLGGALLIWGRRGYRRDVATALASQASIARSASAGASGRRTRARVRA
jgi:MFS family permease